MRSCWNSACTVVVCGAVLVARGLASVTPTTKTTCSGGRIAQSTECCKFYDILDDVQANIFIGGQCDAESREVSVPFTASVAVPDRPQSLRLMFHDAISYSTSANGTFSGGGADGSIVEHAEIETAYAENTGLDDMAYEQRALALKHSVSYGDLLHFTGAVGLSNCDGAPRLRFFAGRNMTSKPAPDGLIPAPFHSVDTILARMKDAGFSPEEMVILLASHSIGTQHTIDPTVDGMPLDSTPQEFDTQYYLDTALPGTFLPGNGSNRGQVMSPSPHQLRLQSDYELARDPRTSCTWQSYISTVPRYTHSFSRVSQLTHASNPVANQEKMNRDFVQVMSKVSTLGQDMSKLVDCSDVIPIPKALPRGRRSAALPPGKRMSDVETSCAGYHHHPLDAP
ncbi:manganese peroxidase [Cytidiella melzeri]|nr:manganese peroxidase [Cytidiella melzeri]